MGGAGVWSRGVPTGAWLGLLALVELAVRRQFAPSSITRLAVTDSVVRTADGGVRFQFFILLCLLGLAGTLPLLLRRPTVAALTLTSACVLSLALFQTVTVAGVIAQLVAGYRLGRSGSRALAVVLGLPFLALALAARAPAEAQLVTILLASLIPAASVAGIAGRARTENVENTAARQLIAGSLLEHTVRGERARISRELHDVVAHHISMIAVQAETARLTTPGMPAAGAKQLRGIGDAARSALTEMRRLLDVLREDTPAEIDDRRPQPGLLQLNELLDEARDASGAGVRLIVHGPPDHLDPGVELAVYRIVQESLTNARRHAPGAAVDVEMRYLDKSLRLRIRDNGPGPSPTAASGGLGLLGMRERTAAVGGEVRIGPAVGGGFLIEATLPVTTERAG